ncbi:MAG: UDP-N-acetylmuramoyl-L-alanine--D-glutamate ligase [Anaerolineae bacterium]|nr:UDP-N-acetylmuramoyl-L-alanine--D-glutamate ligase [Anaerolineae bacterium]
MELKDRRVLVVGLARQGTALARFLVGEGAQVTVTDIQPAQALAASLAALEGLPIRTALGGHPLSLLDDTDLVCLSGGVPTNIPLVAEARRRGIALSNDALLTLERSPATVMGITGSSGKTTTATLVGLILQEAGIPAHVGGNIGTPLIDRLDELQPGQWAVMELSSFQLELFDRSPPVAAVTNVTPNHLDRHGTMAAYSAAKANILRWQTADDVCVLGADDRVTGQWLRRGRVGAGPRPAPTFPIRAQRFGFSLQEEMAAGAFLRGEDLVLRLPGQPEAVICRRESIRLRGRHNVANLLAACILAGIAGAPPEAMARVAVSFEGVEHRLEVVRVLNGVLWVNDSIATSPERAVAAIQSFDEPIVLLAGGRDKKLPWDEFARWVHRRVKCLVLFGEAAALIEEVVRGYGLGVKEKPSPPPHPPALIRCADLQEAVDMAYHIAEPGDVVLLAPGGTSFDAYRDFVARGEHFRALVQAL